MTTLTLKLPVSLATQYQGSVVLIESRSLKDSSVCRLGDLLRNSEKSERDRERVWADVCWAADWTCKLCDAVTERGRRFYGDVCDDCKLRIKNE